jgi:hypothetical protein
MREPPAATARHHLLSVRQDEPNQLDEPNRPARLDEQNRPDDVPRGLTPPVPPGWTVFRSDAGRYWATKRRFGGADEAAGVWRTVDADDPAALTRLIAEQEHRAASRS